MFGLFTRRKFSNEELTLFSDSVFNIITHQISVGLSFSVNDDSNIDELLKNGFFFGYVVGYSSQFSMDIMRNRKFREEDFIENGRKFLDFVVIKIIFKNERNDIVNKLTHFRVQCDYFKSTADNQFGSGMFSGRLDAKKVLANGEVEGIESIMPDLLMHEIVKVNGGSWLPE